MKKPFWILFHPKKNYTIDHFILIFLLDTVGTLVLVGTVELVGAAVVLEVWIFKNGKAGISQGLLRQKRQTVRFPPMRISPCLSSPRDVSMLVWLIIIVQLVGLRE